MNISDFDAKVLVAQSATESFLIVRWGSIWSYVIMNNRTKETEQRGARYDTKTEYVNNAIKAAHNYDFIDSEVVPTFARFTSVRVSTSQRDALVYLVMQSTTPPRVRAELNALLVQLN
ncbi:MAG: hypothetical protein JKX78_02995 [Alteromonadaceae bacterium]|nr:hypothetical protein [Alteromonadaceae bacterium]